MNKIRNLFFAGLTILLFIEVIIVFPRHLDSTIEEVSPIEKPTETLGTSTAEQSMEGVHLVESKGGEKVWELFSAKAEGYENKNSWHLNDVRLLFYTQNKINFTVTGSKGFLEAKSRNITIQGRVEMRSGNGYLFKTDEIVYLASQGHLVSEKAIVMEGPIGRSPPELVVKAGKMVTYVDESRIVLQKQVRSKRHINNQKPIDITSEIAEFSSNSRLARFQERVTIQMGTAQIQGAAADFQYQGAGNDLDSVYLKGGVKFKEGDRTATAENIKIDVGINRFVLKGSPKLVQNEDELLGEEIVFLDGGKKVKVERVRARVENIEDTGK